MEKYDITRFVNFGTLLGKKMEPDVLYGVALKEAMAITNCDGGTIYSVDVKNKQLIFEYVITKSKNTELSSQTGANTIKPVPLLMKYVCANAVKTKRILNIQDVYYSKEYDFDGTRQYDKMNNYRTGSMLVVPMLIESDRVIGVLQLINALDENGQRTAFTSGHERLISSLGTLVGLKLVVMKDAAKFDVMSWDLL